MGSIRIVGAGRAGGSFALALGGVGWVPEVMLRGVPLEAAADGVDVVLLGPASEAQLTESIEAAEKNLPAELLAAIDAAHREFTGTDASYAR